MPDEKEKKGFVIFGRDITKIPCFRNSFLYGISSGIGGSLVYFLFSSRPQSSMHFGVATMSMVTMVYWVQCRYNYSKAKFETLKMQQLLKYQNLYEGSEQERQLDLEIQKKLDLELQEKAVEV